MKLKNKFLPTRKRKNIVPTEAEVIIRSNESLDQPSTSYQQDINEPSTSQQLDLDPPSVIYEHDIEQQPSTSYQKDDAPIRGYEELPARLYPVIDDDPGFSHSKPPVSNVKIQPTPSYKLNIRPSKSYNSIEPDYNYSDEFGSNFELYKHRKTKWIGILLAFLSGTFFTISAALVKTVSNVDPMIMLTIRSLIQISLMILITRIKKVSLFGPKDYKMLIQLQGLVGGITLTLLYFSFRRLPLGDATTIIFSSPVIVIILSAIFLKEPCGLLRTAVIVVLFIGVILVSRPPFIFENYKIVTYDVLGYICALLATFFTAFNVVVMRKCKDVHFSVIVFNLSFWTVVCSMLLYAVAPTKLVPNTTFDAIMHPINSTTELPVDQLLSSSTLPPMKPIDLSTPLPIIPMDTSTLLPIQPHTLVPIKPFTLITIKPVLEDSTTLPINGTDELLDEPKFPAFPTDGYSWFMMILVTIFGLSGQILLAKALKIEGAGKVSVTRSLDIILAYIIQVYLFGDLPSATSIIGAILILFCVFCMGFEKEIYGLFEFMG